MASVIAVDLGNQNCVIALPQNGGVDIVCNQSSQRLTPTMVAIDNDRRYAGEFAKTQQMQNVNGTITNLKRLIGVKYDDPEREIVEKLTPLKLVKLDDGYIGVELTYGDKPIVLRIEQLLALMFKEVLKIAKLNGSTSNEVVLVVSPWWSERQRRVILDAAKISCVKIMKLLNSTTAQAICYSMYHRSKLPATKDKAVPVAFIDFGDSSLNVSIAQLYQGAVDIKSFACDQHFGGAHFTAALQELLLEMTMKKYKIDPRTNARAMLRFNTAVERAKKVLSINPVVRFEVQCLMNDIDVRFDFKREDFEAKIVDLVKRLDEPINKALELAGVKKEDLFAIEVHGGASRVAAVKAHIKEIFGRDPTQSLNPDECFAMGAGFQAAILSPKYKVNLNVNDVAPHTVMIEYTDADGNKKNPVLFKQFNKVPSTKEVSIKVARKTSVRIYTDECDLGNIEIDTGKDEPDTVNVQIRMTPDSVIDVKDANIVVTEQIPIKEEKKPETKKDNSKKDNSKKEEEKKSEDAKKVEEPKFKTVKKNVPVSLKYTPAFGLSDKVIEELKKIEIDMEKKDILEEKIDFAKNDLESYIFRMMNGMDRDFPEYFDPKTKDADRAKVDEVQAWFSDNEFDRLPLVEYEKQIGILHAFGEPALRRKDLFAGVHRIVSTYQDRKEAAIRRLDQKDEKFSHITEKERKPIRDELNAYGDWLKQRQADCETAPKHLDPPLTSNAAESRIANLEEKVQKLLCKPKPKPEPKKEEKKKDDKKDKDPKNEKKGKSEEEEKKEVPKTEVKSEDSSKQEDVKQA
ncbi:dnaK protein [Trichomonas vaginalis G3]|uniref:DnaK protein n=1 Tax=Trichomonas vaginalis (strain ATCC PRA-98 / G3) TaxID=412133 RepID=A2ELS7_TRIV3|nr:HSC70CB, isoform G-related family [Trichomonas vaginalis G3]EAY06355.1 dnaK protein [Trichomonas vaginalis G3]KAI5534706.1 HSC70CB, isoform G-related family [Trichomonas vaginalis G3]|eukprot:XP_001318578.1 dnaK protein [Trichomonas vaginalis G3]